MWPDTPTPAMVMAYDSTGHGNLTVEGYRAMVAAAPPTGQGEPSLEMLTEMACELGMLPRGEPLVMQWIPALKRQFRAAMKAAASGQAEAPVAAEADFDNLDALKDEATDMAMHRDAAVRAFACSVTDLLLAPKADAVREALAVVALPELPEPAGSTNGDVFGHADEPLYTSDQMLAYAQGAIAHMHAAYCHSQQQFLDAQSAIAALTEQLEAAREDAARYRWLRSGDLLRQGVRIAGHREIGTVQRATMTFHYWCSPELLDAAIDSARGKGTEAS